MKELSIEEKAKAYDEAFERAKNFIENGDERERTIAESIFAGIMEESEDERIRKAIINVFATHKDYEIFFGVSVKDIIAWLEKQGEHANFLNNIQIGDKVTRNRDGVLVNLSQLNRVAKKDEKQGEQKPQRMVSAEAKEAMYGKPAWSEEDERCLTNAIYACKQMSDEDYDYSQGYIDAIKWLKSLKGRVQPQPKQEWGEDDKKLWVHDDDIFLDAAKMIVEDSPRKSYGGVHKKEIVPWFYSLKERLKSLRPQSHWKPSDEQMEALETTLYSNMSRNDERYSVLSEFVVELKKLKG